MHCILRYVVLCSCCLPLLHYSLWPQLWPFNDWLLSRLTTVQKHKKCCDHLKTGPISTLSSFELCTVNRFCPPPVQCEQWQSNVCLTWKNECVCFVTGLWKNEFDAVGACHRRWGKSVNFSYVRRYRFLSHAAKISFVLRSLAAGITQVSNKPWYLTHETGG